MELTDYDDYGFLATDLRIYGLGRLWIFSYGFTDFTDLRIRTIMDYDDYGFLATDLTDLRIMTIMD